MCFYSISHPKWRCGWTIMRIGKSKILPYIREKCYKTWSADWNRSWRFFSITFVIITYRWASCGPSLLGAWKETIVYYGFVPTSKNTVALWKLYVCAIGKTLYIKEKQQKLTFQMFGWSEGRKDNLPRLKVSHHIFFRNICYLQASSPVTLMFYCYFLILSMLSV